MARLFWRVRTPFQETPYARPFVSVRDCAADAVLFAIAGGAVFANLLLVAAIEIAGLAVAFPVGIGLALVVGVLLNYAISPKGHPGLLFGGMFLVVLAIIFDALAYRRRERERCSVSTRGIWISVASGVLMGIFYPLTDSAPVSMSQYFRAKSAWHFWGVVGGLIWCTGTVFNFVASHAQIVGPAVCYAIGQGATMVSAVWGIFIWKEFANAPPASRKLIPAMFLFFLLGLGSIAIAPVVTK